MNEKEVKSDKFRNTIQEFEKIFGNMSCKQIYELGQCLFNNYIPKSLVEEKIDKLKAEIETLKREAYLEQKIIDYAKQHAEEYGEEIEVIFLDEDIVRMIIKLGIQEYLKRENEKGKEE